MGSEVAGTGNLIKAELGETTGVAMVKAEREQAETKVKDEIV